MAWVAVEGVACRRMVGELTIEPAAVDLGVVKAGEKRQVILRAVNNSNQPRRIIGFAQTCDCTEVDFDRAAMAPGDGAQIVIRLTVFPGRPEFDVQLTFFIDDGSHMEREVTIRGKVGE